MLMAESCSDFQTQQMQDFHRHVGVEVWARLDLRSLWKEESHGSRMTWQSGGYSFWRTITTSREDWREVHTMQGTDGLAVT